MTAKILKLPFSQIFLDIFKIIILAIVYFIAGEISFLVSQENIIVTIVYFLPEGFALAAILIYGKNIWPGIFIGQFLLASYSGMAEFPALCISVINSFQAIIGLALFDRFNLNRELTSLKDVMGLLFIITIVIQPVSAILGNLVLVLFSISSQSNYLGNTLSWWFGNIMGQFLLTPYLLLLYANYKTLKFAEVVSYVAGFGLMSYVTLVAFPINSLSILMSLTMPLVVLLTFYKNIALAYSAIITISFVALYSSYLGIGVFDAGDSVGNIVDLNFFILSHIFLVLIVGTLVNEMNSHKDKLKSMATYDYLTGLPNRNLLNERFNNVIAIAHRHHIASAICFADVDGFKYVNDTFGHSTGDRVLKEIAHRIHLFIKEEDSLIRLGGDEFLIILAGIDSDKDIRQILGRISATVNEPMLIKEHDINVSLSIGVAICPDDGDTIADLMDFSDKAMYLAKRKGANCFVFHGE